jgi:hypothetical protein
MLMTKLQIPRALSTGSRSSGTGKTYLASRALTAAAHGQLDIVAHRKVA